jgi:hypothetical protein
MAGFHPEIVPFSLGWAMTRSQLSAALSFTLLAAFGCGGGDGSTVSGEVTFNGKPLDKGYVTFNPSDGKGKPVGAEIVGGKYTARNVAPGKNKVLVTSTVAGQASDSMDAAIAEAKKAKGGPPADAPTDKSDGNNQEHDIPSGGHTLNLTIKTASSSDGKVR